VIPYLLMAKKDSEEVRLARESKKAQKQAAANALRDLRKANLDRTEVAIRRLVDELKSAKKAENRLNMLASHLEGFYEEIDKLTKGKALLPVTPLMVEQANDIVRDAKEIVSGDTHLDRIKEFVPAGDNPLYPDVLVVMRGVRDSLNRGRAQPKRHRDHVVYLLREARTMAVALQLNIESGEEPVLREQVAERLEKDEIASVWFIEDEDGSLVFDFNDLDSRDIESYLSRSPDDDDSSQDDDEDDGGDSQEEDSGQDKER
jgi:hypothetical protein